LPNPRAAVILANAMNHRAGIVVLILICAALSVVLIWSQKRAGDRRAEAAEHITSFSNQMVKANNNLEEERKVRAELEIDRLKQHEAFFYLSNAYNEVAANLNTSREQLAQREVRIADLESQNAALDQHALELSLSITNLTAEIAETRRKLAASEGDKEALVRDLARLTNEKADLERQFNDISALRAKLKELKEEMNIARRIDWMRKGLANAADQKGAEQLMQKTLLSGTTPPPRPPNYDLNVEIGVDGTRRIVRPGSSNSVPR
jgi:chromosome segregation ATPase